EMESTRTELRRGILELPAETAESAAQMRRVIVEQIDALAELNRIVARHGRDAPEQTRRSEPMVASAGGRPERSELRSERSELRPERSDMRPERSDMRPAARIEQVPGRSNPPPRRPEPAPAPAAPEGGRSGGWLPALLSR